MYGETRVYSTYENERDVNRSGKLIISVSQRQMEIALTVTKKNCDTKSESPLCCNFGNEVELGI